uniref:Uncharacterized protein n=1 Tax=Anguilla anguilla TaxID=7936 RepID=A0A0E9R1N9_ANGAN
MKGFYRNGMVLLSSAPTIRLKFSLNNQVEMQPQQSG